MMHTTLGLILGTGCNANCRICLWGSKLNNGPVMSVKNACNWIDQTHKYQGLKLIGFSGGELFLYLDTMKQIADYAMKKHGVPSGVSTNSFWAKTRDEAYNVLSILYEKGLREMLVSVDDFHQEYIPLEYVKNSLDVAQKLGIHSNIQCVKTQSSHGLRYYIKALGISSGENLQANEIQCTPIGSAASEIPREEFPSYAILIGLLLTTYFIKTKKSSLSIF